MAKGGRQPGAGRPKGSTNKPSVADCVSAEDQKMVMAHYVKRAMVNDSVLIHLVDQLKGRAKQAIDHTTNGENMNGVVILPAKNDAKI